MDIEDLIYYWYGDSENGANLMRLYDELYPKIKDDITRNATFYPLGYAIGSLYTAKKEMDDRNIINSDNYYHRLGMSQIGQEAKQTPATLLWGELLGLAKEGYDFGKKTIKGDNIFDTLKDNWKDMKNNNEALYWGLTNPNKNNRIWLRDLDINSNIWKSNETSRK